MRCLFVAFLATAVCIAYTTGLAVMSIDLGSEFMKVAIVKPGVPMEIALNKESQRKTVVLVALDNDDRVFGDAGLVKAVRYPKRAYRYMQDILGKRADNPGVTRFAKRFPYYDTEEDPDRKTLVFKHDEDTLYTPEELMAMVLEAAKETASNFAEQPITDAVITVPPFFNQAERRSLMRAATMAGINLLQLMNDNTAVALNYGVFRRKAFNQTAVHYLFFDMGAGSTTATIVAYQLVKAKNPATGVMETNPQLTIKGVGYDRTLGGLEFQLRLRDHLAKLFNEQKKTKNDVTKNPRAMAKLLKEAGRLKHVLSANNDHYSQVEGLLDDQDFRAKVSRADVEGLCPDLFERIAKPVEEAMKTSQVTWEEISEVILMGGATRMPKVQAMLSSTTGRSDLGKSINTDEAAAMGAVYQAAHLSKGFRVKKFLVKDANLFPISVEFERVRISEGNVETSKTVKRTLFGRMNPFPQKKVMTFNKNTDDFDFNVNYAELGFMSAEELKEFGETHLQKVSLSGVGSAHEKNKEKGEYKGIKAHFKLDDSGVLTLDKAESLFELPPDAVPEEEEESTLSKLGSFIFGSSTKDAKKEDEDGAAEEPKEEVKAEEKEKENEGEEKEKEKKEEEAKAENKEEKKSEKKDAEKEKEEKVTAQQHEAEKKEEAAEDEAGKKEEEPEEKAQESDEKKSKNEEEQPKKEKKTKKMGEKSDEKVDSKDEKKNEKKDDKKEQDKKNDTKEEEKAEKKPAKPTMIKEDITIELSIMDLTDPTEDDIKMSKKKIEDLAKRDQEKRKLEAIKNDLESFIIDGQDKLYQKMYEDASTEAEREDMREKLSAASDWLYEQDENSDFKVYNDKLKELKKLMAALYERVKEHEERPRAIEALNTVVNYSSHFLVNMKNFTGEDKPFTQVEYDTLDKLITDTKEWNKTISKEQKKTPLTEKPKMLVEDVAKKIGELDREVKYLINKAKVFRPKEKKEKKTKKSNETKTEEKTEGKDGEPEEIKIEPTEAEAMDAVEVPEETKNVNEEEEETVEKKKPNQKLDKTNEKESEEEEVLHLDSAQSSPDDKPDKETKEENSKSSTNDGHDPNDEL